MFVLNDKAHLVEQHTYRCHWPSEGSSLIILPRGFLVRLRG